MKIINLEQGSPEWRAFRKKHIGASEISSISGSNPWKSAYELWLEKTGRKDAEMQNTAMQRGNELEPLAREAYMEVTGIGLTNPVVQSDLWDIATASLDGLSLDHTRALEAKCPTSRKLYDKSLIGQIPPYYQDQIQWIYFVADEVKQCDFMVYMNNSEFKIIENVEIDVKRQEELLKMAAEFWSFVENDTPPPKDEVELITKDSVFDQDLLERWKECKEKETLITKEKKLLEDQIEEIYKNQNCLFPEAQVKLIWISKKGNIDWKKFQFDKKIKDSEVESYRKCETIYPKLSILE